eukprot:scpid41137/ scgid11431/ Coiled-coil domain-containing protein 22 homolog
MDEVDNIIIVSLRQIGCAIDENTISLTTFSTDQVVEGCARCLKLIDESIELPTRLPESMSVRFRVGTALANACKKVGFEGEVGYQTFLYSNVADIRRVFMFLLEKLPRESGDAEDSSKSGAHLYHRITTVLAQERSRVWTPLFCKEQGLVSHDDGSITWEGNQGIRPHMAVPVAAPSGLAELGKRTNKDLCHYYRNHLPFVTAQPQQRHQVAASLLERSTMEVTAAAEWEHEWNTNGLPSRLSEQEYRQRKRERLHKRLTDNIRGSVQTSGVSTLLRGSLAELLDSFSSDSHGTDSQGSRFSHAKNLQFTQADVSSQVAATAAAPAAETQEEIKQRREDELTALRSKLDAASEAVLTMEGDMQKFSTSMSKVEEQSKTLVEANSTGKDEYKLKKRALEMLSNVDENLGQLQGLVDAASQRLVTLAEQWEKHRQPLIAQHRALKSAQSELSGDTKVMLEEIPHIRQRIKELMEDGRAKEYLNKQLSEELGQLNKTLNRSAYTRRIMEIINNIKKQKDEVQKILSDTRQLQKDINYLEGELERAFAVADEVIFVDCKKHEINRQIYKLLAKLHETFSGLLEAIRETAIVVRENRELEDQIEKEEKKGMSQNLQRIESDCNAMRQENRVLINQYKVAE